MKTTLILRLKRTVGRATIFILLILAVLVSAANLAYYAPLPADLPCRGCYGEARSVKVNGFDLYYREVGSSAKSTPVVIVHGGPGHSSQSFKGGFEFLAKDRRVIYYDQRGSGYSQIKTDSKAYTIDQLVEELEALRSEVIQTEKMIVIGHSAGGALAQRYALRYPQRVERLILVSSILLNNGISAPLAWNIFGPAFFVIGAGIPPAEPETADAWFEQALVLSSLPRLYDQSQRALIEDSGYISFATWRAVSHSMSGPDQRGALRDLPVRTMIIYGEADAGYTGKENAATLCSLIPDCRLVGFERSGHWPFLEEPQRFTEEVLSFLYDTH